MPRIGIQGADGTYYQSDIWDISQAGEWVAKALQMLGIDQYNAAQIRITPLFVRGNNGQQVPDWPVQASDKLIFPVMNLRGLIDKLQAIEKEERL